MGARWLRGVALCLPLLCGCGTTYHLLQVRPAVGTNHGRPLYLLVRAMERKAYLSESYQDVTTKVLNRDKSVLRLEVVHPGHARRFIVGVPRPAGLGLYFLFTKPSPGWRMYVEPPVPLVVTVELEGNHIKP